MSQADSIVTMQLEGAVLRVRMNRPAARNALNAAMLRALRSSFEHAAENPDVRAVLLEGEGSVFCAGGDLKEIFSNPTPLGIRRFLDEEMRPVLRAITQLGKPVVSALAGPVAGAGIGIALSADIIIAAERASFVPAFGKVGAMPDSSVLYLMVRNIGVLRTKEIVLRNLSLTATEAAALGLYTRVVADAELPTVALSIAQEVATGPTVAHGLAKHVLQYASTLSFDAFMEMESMAMGLLNTTGDQREGLAAFAERREPVFAGR
ncbi:enoyl-CoA hydratase/isomerase family protein [Thauera sp. 63]|uniref:enoyl-CoA hydratase/isomerase family protein n=1 Tax=Thauera sp. 63 TaxID=497321 RepID=UPI0002CD707D|nr:enoyl-CoA hydratase-related protein [Thauera sp. 63]ENO79122.1 enoyl-CoA hydratase/isomerase [Thauera sp. 63]